MALVASLLGSWVIWNKNKKHQNLLRKHFEPICRLTSKRTSRTTAIFNMVALSLSLFLSAVAGVEEGAAVAEMIDVAWSAVTGIHCPPRALVVVI